MLKFLKYTLAPVLMLPVLAWGQTTQNLTTLAAEAVHPSTLKEIISSLNEKHYNKVTIDDQLSSKLLDGYLKSLDPGRSYFYQEDILEFEKLRFTLDDEIKKNKLNSGFLIYNRLQQRILERATYAIAKLESKKPFDYSLDEYIEIDREKAPWIQTTSKMDDLWRKRLKNAMLNLTLTDTPEAEAKDILIKRYKTQIKQLVQTNSEDIFQTYVNNLTRLYDPHTSYFSPRNSENFKINMSLSLQGIGAVLQTEDEFTKIVRLIPSGPADKTGKLRANDMIIGVGQGANGDIEDVIGWRLDDVVQKIRGKKGTSVRLKIRPATGDKTLSKIVSIKRNTVKLEEQAAQKRIIKTNKDGKEYKIGVIEIPTFYIDFAALQRGDKNYKSTTRDVEKLINELNKEDIDGLVIDLRNNGGGALQEANQLVGLFIPRGATVQIKYFNGKVSPLGDSDPKVSYRGPLAVMVNRQSASASEIFAGAIQDYRRGIIIGNQTFGKGTVQSLNPLKHGQLKLTHAKFYRISGESTQNKGVMPDIVLPGLLDNSEYGESALDNALPWDTVAAVKSFSTLDLDPFFDQIRIKKDSRIGKLADFAYINEKIAHDKTLRERQKLSLNKKQRIKSSEMEKQWVIDTENKRLMAKNLPPINQLDDLEKILEKDKLGRPITPETEATLQESVRILIDMKQLLQPKS